MLAGVELAALVWSFSIHAHKLYKLENDQCENYSKFDFCAVITFLQAKGMSRSKIHCRLLTV
jgi:hypothetical protein